MGFTEGINSSEILLDQSTFVYLLLTFLVGGYCFYY